MTTSALKFGKLQIFLFSLLFSMVPIVLSQKEKRGENSEVGDLAQVYGSLTLQLIEKSEFLKLQFTPRENNFEFTIKLDMEHYENFNNKSGGDSKNLEVKTGDGSQKDVEIKSGGEPLTGENGAEKKEPPTPEKITIGFDSGGFVDVISISLMPFEESEDASIINMEAGGMMAPTEHVQDFHWSKKDGILVPDVNQNYELVSFDMGNNGTFFSSTISRPWLTCDTQDIQFSMESIEIWWLLDMSDTSRAKGSSALVRLENLEEESNATLPEEEPKVPDGPNGQAGVAPTTVATTTLIEKNGTLAAEAKEKEAEVLKSIKDQDFKGPILLSVEELLRNFTRVNIQDCEASTSKTTPETYSCSVGNYRQRSDLHSRFHIASVTMMKSSSSMKNKMMSEPETCPSVLQDAMTRKLFKALTGRDSKSRHGAGFKGEGGNNSGDSLHFHSVGLTIIYSAFSMLYV